MPAQTYPSTRRKIVLEVAERLAAPFTAMQIWALCAREHPQFSRATVYRILRRLREEGLVKDVILPHGQRVSIRSDAPAYCITECEVCGAFHMEPALAERVSTALGESARAASQVAIYLKGRCCEPAVETERSIKTSQALPAEAG